MACEIAVRVGSPLRSYTGGAATVQVEVAAPATVASALDALDANHPGIRFRMIDEQDRIRPHIRIYANSDAVTDLGAALAAGDTLHLIGALSGG